MKKTAIILFILISCFQIFAQEIKVNGKVTAFYSVPLKNVKVISKKTSISSITDENGNYSIQCAMNDVLIFEPTGFVKIRKKVKQDSDSLNVNLYFANSRINRELAVTAQHISKEMLEKAIKTLPNPKEDYSIYSDIFDLIKGKFPFVQVSNGQINIPPKTTGNGEVLLMFNGVSVNDISFIQPMEVKSIKVLKGNEASIYGSRGGNGVIEIWTWGVK